MASKRCGFKGCDELVGNGAARIGFDREGRQEEVIACAKCAWTVMIAPRGTYRITPDRQLKAIPAKRIII